MWDQPNSHQWTSIFKRGTSYPNDKRRQFLSDFLGFKPRQSLSVIQSLSYLFRGLLFSSQGLSYLTWGLLFSLESWSQPQSQSRWARLKWDGDNLEQKRGQESHMCVETSCVCYLCGGLACVGHTYQSISSLSLSLSSIFIGRGCPWVGPTKRPCWSWGEKSKDLNKTWRRRKKNDFIGLIRGIYVHNIYPWPSNLIVWKDIHFMPFS